MQIKFEAYTKTTFYLNLKLSTALAVKFMCIYLKYDASHYSNDDTSIPWTATRPAVWVVSQIVIFLATLGHRHHQRCHAWIFSFSVSYILLSTKQKGMLTEHQHVETLLLFFCSKSGTGATNMKETRKHTYYIELFFEVCDPHKDQIGHSKKNEYKS